MFRISANRSLSGYRGLEKFSSLLLKALVENHGVRLVDSGNSDIHFCVIQNERKSGAKTLLRIDGVYYDKKRLTMNRSIKASISQADGVVYQSCWSKKFAETMLKVRSRKSEVIWNGVDQKRFSRDKVSSFDYDKTFICCSHWRINKRLKSIVSAFLEFQNITDTNIGLVVVGSPDYRIPHDKVKFLEHVSCGLEKIYQACDYMCHICHLDACPNTVVEALSAGLPVLCNNIGGTPELVGSDGVVVHLDQEFNFKPIKNMDQVGPSSVNEKLLIDGMREMLSHDWSVYRPDLDISVSAKKYFDFCLELLGGIDE